MIFEERIRQNLANLHRMRRALRARIILVLAGLIALVLFHLRFISVPGVFKRPTFVSLLAMAFLWTLMGTLAVFLWMALGTWRKSLAKRYLEQCQTSLRPFNLHLTHGRQKELTFVRRLPRRLAELLGAFRAEYRARRALQSAPRAKAT